jgi:hypothetical protein
VSLRDFKGEKYSVFFSLFFINYLVIRLVFRKRGLWSSDVFTNKGGNQVILRDVFIKLFGIILVTLLAVSSITLPGCARKGDGKVIGRIDVEEKDPVKLALSKASMDIYSSHFSLALSTPGKKLVLGIKDGELSRGFYLDYTYEGEVGFLLEAVALSLGYEYRHEKGLGKSIVKVLPSGSSYYPKGSLSGVPMERRDVNTVNVVRTTQATNATNTFYAANAAIVMGGLREGEERTEIERKDGAEGKKRIIDLILDLNMELIKFSEEIKVDSLRGVLELTKIKTLED